MAIKSYQDQAELLLKEYLLADSFIPYTSIIVGISACKMVYDLTQLFSLVYFKSYSNLTKMQRVEWNNRAISTVHAIFITVISLYLVFCSDLYSDHRAELMIFQASSLSTFALGVIHHFISMVAVAYAMLIGEGQLYIYMVLISETTTPGVNLRWYLDTAGMKRSRAYLINGVVIFFAWLVARILLFMYFFYHVYLHYDQVKQLDNFGKVLILTVPLVLSVMNIMWFWKIIKGLKKTLAKRH
ncbi:TLC domain-containing protein 4 isoform X2 [Manihot esculenta]|uniref:Uncharacterized protein n=1 Tax=Manihot esculenta TaxID=3983 RepID=A0ACB7I4V8_MANES|nr:TLC domain-containing protein 4 isoform X2 [Manihot esculenta]KAG8659877.1 hypothetical protein MANES_02G088800v8 [Manihot esculenta]